jgi:hypothetical protein
VFAALFALLRNAGLRRNQLFDPRFHEMARIGTILQLNVLGHFLVSRYHPPN